MFAQAIVGERVNSRLHTRKERESHLPPNNDVPKEMKEEAYQMLWDSPVMMRASELAEAVGMPRGAKDGEKFARVLMDEYYDLYKSEHRCAGIGIVGVHEDE